MWARILCPSSRPISSYNRYVNLRTVTLLIFAGRKLCFLGSLWLLIRSSQGLVWLSCQPFLRNHWPLIFHKECINHCHPMLASLLLLEVHLVSQYGRLLFASSSVLCKHLWSLPLVWSRCLQPFLFICLLNGIYLPFLSSLVPVAWESFAWP